jgi:hypothetical protein
MFVFGNCPLELADLYLMILYLYGQAFDTGFIRQSFWDGPALEHAILFEPEIKVMTPGVMLLHNKSWQAHGIRRLVVSCGFGKTTFPSFVVTSSAKLGSHKKR